MILFVFLVNLFCTVLQCTLFGGHLSRRNLLPASPLLWGWAAYAVLELIRVKILFMLLPVGVAFLVWDSFRTSLEHLWKPSKMIELEAVETLAPVIAADWDGAEFFDPGLWWDRYCAPDRPIVQCEDFPLTGYRAGGRVFLPDSPKKLQPDYIVVENYTINEAYFVIWTGKIGRKCYIIGKYYTNQGISNE